MVHQRCLGVGGLITRVKQKNLDAVGTHCVIHREALASKTLPAAMKKKLAIIIQIVNFIKSSAVNSRLFSQLCKHMNSNHENLLFHTNVRWLSKGNMLARVYGLKDEVVYFLNLRENKISCYHSNHKSFNWQWHTLLTFSKLSIASIYCCKERTRTV